MRFDLQQEAHQIIFKGEIIYGTATKIRTIPFLRTTLFHHFGGTCLKSDSHPIPHPGKQVAVFPLSARRATRLPNQNIS